MAEYYVTEERAFAPGISGKWPPVIEKPDSPDGRLVKVEDVDIDGLIAAARQVLTWLDEDWFGRAILNSDPLRRLSKALSPLQASDEL